MASAPSSNETSQEAWLQGNVRLVRLPRFDDERGSLVPFEFDQLPFLPRRLFTVQEVPAGTARGRHALRNQRQLLICVTGSIDVSTRLDHESVSLNLDQPHIGLLVEPGVWVSLRFVAVGSVLVALASGLYDPDDYTPESTNHDG